MQEIDTVFLDRDGVLNKKLPEGCWVRCWEEFHLLAGVEDAIARLNGRGIRVVVVSNQRGVALGVVSLQEVDAIHARLQRHLAGHGARIDEIFVCPHDRGKCICRKPQRGLFEQAVARYPDIVAGRSLMIGDSCSDIEFGKGVGMAAVLIDGGREDGKGGHERAMGLADGVCSGLREAVDQLLQ